MTSCEKCWKDAQSSNYPIAEYCKLVEERDCSPEEQAGPRAKVCTLCDRNTIHQVTNVCVICKLDV